MVVIKTGGINPHMKDLGPVFPVIKNFKGKTLKQSALMCGKDNPYPFIHISCGGKCYKCSLHKIVGLAFLPNDDFKNKCIIDHLDNNILNYMPENLEWVSHSENSLRRYDYKSFFLSVHGPFFVLGKYSFKSNKTFSDNFL